MKVLDKLEKRKEVWFLLFISFIFFLLRLPSLIEPYWYGDEAIYELIGLALNNGRMLYSQIWDNKPPLLYLIYAIANADQFTVRFLSLASAVTSTIFFYYLSDKLFRSNKINIISTLLYTFFFATPILEGNIANAENFMLLPIIGAGILVYKASEIKKIPPGQGKIYPALFFAGLLLGVAFLLKIVAVFDFAAFFIFLAFIFLPDRISIKEYEQQFKESLKKLAIYSFGFLIPLAGTLIYFFVKGSISDFVQATFLNNISYVEYKNKFIISQGFLLLKLVALTGATGILFWKKNAIPKSVMFIFLWFIFSFFNAFFSGRGWNHYLLVLLPSAILLTGLLFDRKAGKFKIAVLGLLLILIYCVNLLFKVGPRTIGKTLQYYQNFALFITNNKSVRSYQEYFDRRVPRDYEVARFITNNTRPNDLVFVWGNNPQIYVLSNTLPPGKYIVEYHIKQSVKSIEETAHDLRRTKPRYLIILSDTTGYPFGVGTYINRISFEGANIYERTF